MKNKNQVYLNVIQQALVSKDNRTIKELINDHISASFTLIYDNQFFEVLISYFSQLAPEQTNSQESKLREFIKKLLNEGIISSENAKIVVSQLSTLKTLRKIAQERLSLDPISVLQQNFSMEPKKSDLELIVMYKELREKLFMRIEDNATEDISLPQRNQEIVPKNIPLAVKQPQKEVDPDSFDCFLEKLYQSEKADEIQEQKLLKEVDLIREIISQSQLQEIFKLKYIYLVPYGSVVSGFSQKNSDLDLSINTGCYIPQKEFLMLLRNFIQNYCKDQAIEKVQVKLIGAETPVLEYQKGSIHIDITINNILGCVNSKMLRGLAGIDPIIPKLGIVIKAWAKVNLLSSKDNLSSYAFILMMFYFLFRQKYLNSLFLKDRKNPKNKNNPNYQCMIKRLKKNEESFQACLYITDEDVLREEYQKKIRMNQDPDRKFLNELTLGELFEKFIQFYKKAEDFPDRRIISLDFNKGFKMNDKYYFNIEDPFDIEHNPGQKTNEQAEKYKQAFSNALKDIERKQYEHMFTQWRR